MTFTDIGVTRSLLDDYRHIATSTIGHFTDTGYLPGIRPLCRPARIVGRALTVALEPMDGSAIREALIAARPGDVLVIDMGRDNDRACWGELRTLAALKKQLAGVVTNGCATDSKALNLLGFAVFGAGISAITTRPLGRPGQIRQPVTLAGTRIEDGDLVIADEDGVFVLDPADARELLGAARQKQSEEQQRRDRLT